MLGDKTHYKLFSAEKGFLKFQKRSCSTEHGCFEIPYQMCQTYFSFFFMTQISITPHIKGMTNFILCPQMTANLRDGGHGHALFLPSSNDEALKNGSKYKNTSQNMIDINWQPC